MPQLIANAKRYEFVNISRDEDGDLQGVIEFKYDGKEAEHEFCYLSNDNCMVSVDYGWKIPYLEDVWKKLEDYLYNYNYEWRKCNEKNNQILSRK